MISFFYLLILIFMYSFVICFFLDQPVFFLCVIFNGILCMCVCIFLFMLFIYIIFRSFCLHNSSNKSRTFTKKNRFMYIQIRWPWTSSPILDFFCNTHVSFYMYVSAYTHDSFVILIPVFAKSTCDKWINVYDRSNFIL